MKRQWVYSPHSGGRKIPDLVQEKIRDRILAYAQKHYSGKFNRIDVRFRGAFCYIDAYVEPDVPKRFNEKLFGETREEHINRLRNTPIHLCRIRYFGREDSWSMAFYTYSHKNTNRAPSITAVGQGARKRRSKSLQCICSLRATQSKLTRDRREAPPRRSNAIGAAAYSCIFVGAGGCNDRIFGFKFKPTPVIRVSGMHADYLRSKDRAISEWLERSRLNPSRGLRQRTDDPQVQQASKRYAENVRHALQKLRQFLSHATACEPEDVSTRSVPQAVRL